MRPWCLLFDPFLIPTWCPSLFYHLWDSSDQCRRFMIMHILNLILYFLCCPSQTYIYAIPNVSHVFCTDVALLPCLSQFSFVFGLPHMKILCLYPSSTTICFTGCDWSQRTADPLCICKCGTLKIFTYMPIMTDQKISYKNSQF